MGDGVEQMLVTGQLPVCGTFSINADIDARYIVSPLDFAQFVLQREGQVSRIELVPDAHVSADDLRAALEPNASNGNEDPNAPGKKCTHSFDQSRRKMGHVCHSQFHFGGGCFNILAALTMLLLDKRRDIATLSAMGMTPREIRKVFSWQGILINAVGAAAGVTLGAAFGGGARPIWLGATGRRHGPRLPCFRCVGQTFWA